MTEVDRVVYLPKWCEHEYFHWFFSRYSELNLEPTPHSWFDRETWPDDFAGVFETDYFIEAANKRFQDLTPPFHQGVRFSAPPAATLAALSDLDLSGRFERCPLQNDWQAGDLSLNPDGGYDWSNDAGVSWNVAAPDGESLAMPFLDGPYFPEGSFQLQLRRGANGDFDAAAPKVTGITHGGGQPWTRCPCVCE